jgi:WD40 repeat protein
MLITASEDCTARVWNTKTRKCTRVIKGHDAEVLRVTW